MQPGPEVLRIIVLAMTRPCFRNMRGMTKTQMNGLIRLQKRNPMTGGCTICTAMYGSGVRTGTEITLLAALSTLKALTEAAAVSFAVAVGTTTRVTAGRASATTTRPATAPAGLAFALFRGLSLFTFTLLLF